MTRQRQIQVLEYLDAGNEVDPFEFAESVQTDDRIRDSHHWAPIFSRLKREGYTEWTGERRLTSKGGESNVHRITVAGRDFLADLQGL